VQTFDQSRRIADADHSNEYRDRSVHWFGVESADAYRQGGASTFIDEIAPDPTTGYDLSVMEEMVAWRDREH
jgi:hypothetical protein